MKNFSKLQDTSSKDVMLNSVNTGGNHSFSYKDVSHSSEYSSEENPIKMQTHDQVIEHKLDSNK